MSLQVVNFITTDIYSPNKPYFPSSKLVPYHILQIPKTWIISSQIFCL